MVLLSALLIARNVFAPPDSWLWREGSCPLSSRFRHCGDGCPQSGIWRRRVFEQLQHQEAVTFGEKNPFGLLDNSLSLSQSGLQDKIRQVRMSQRRRALERGPLLRAQPTSVQDGSSQIVSIEGVQ